MQYICNARDCIPDSCALSVVRCIVLLGPWLPAIRNYTNAGSDCSGYLYRKPRVTRMPALAPTGHKFRIWAKASWSHSSLWHPPTLSLLCSSSQDRWSSTSRCLATTRSLGLTMKYMLSSIRHSTPPPPPPPERNQPVQTVKKLVIQQRLCNVQRPRGKHCQYYWLQLSQEGVWLPERKPWF